MAPLECRGGECWLQSACNLIKNNHKWTVLSNFAWVKTWKTQSDFAHLGLRVHAWHPFLSICFLIPLFWNLIPRSGRLAGFHFHHLPLQMPSPWPIFFFKLCLGSHIHSWKPFPIASILTYLRTLSALSNQTWGRAEYLFFLPSLLTTLTLQETKLKSWQILTWLSDLKSLLSSLHFR